MTAGCCFKTPPGLSGSGFLLQTSKRNENARGLRPRVSCSKMEKAYGVKTLLSEYPEMPDSGKREKSSAIRLARRPD